MKLCMAGNSRCKQGGDVLEVPFHLGKLLKNNDLTDRIQPEEPNLLMATELGFERSSTASARQRTRSP
mgnify:CR=1 FL=1